MYEVVEDVVFLWVQVQQFVVQFEVVGIDVQQQWFVLQVWVCVVGVVVDQGVQVQQQFFGLEWFGQVVIGVGVEIGQFVVLVGLCGQYQYWEFLVGLVLVFDYVQVIQVGQIEIDYCCGNVFDLFQFFYCVVFGVVQDDVIGVFQ